MPFAHNWKEGAARSDFSTPPYEKPLSCSMYKKCSCRMSDGSTEPCLWRVLGFLHRETIPLPRPELLRLEQMKFDFDTFSSAGRLSEADSVATPMARSEAGAVKAV